MEQTGLSRAAGDTELSTVPAHVAIIMDGNGRWAEQQGKPRHVGHRAGVESVRRVMSVCANSGVQVVTLFAFSSENWRRPQSEVNLLMEIFITALDREIKRLKKRNIKLKIIGDITAFPDKLQHRIVKAEQQTEDNTGLLLQVAANYGGRWDIVQASRKLARMVQLGVMSPEDIDQNRFSSMLATGEQPDPDLFIRTGGERRISNFLLWQSAYTELYFTDVLWPDFGEQDMLDAFKDYANRQRRFGMTGAQAGSC